MATKPPSAATALAKPTPTVRRQPPQRALTSEYVEALKLYSEVLFKGGLAPKGVSRPEAVAALIEIGRDVGLSATQAVANIMIVNGRPTIYGDAGLALVRASGLLEWITEELTGEGDDTGYTCTTKRVGDAGPKSTRFTVGDAKQAKLWKKEGPWITHPDRMLMFKARGFNLRDNYGDVLLGLTFFEDATDEPRVVVAEVVETPAVASQEEPGGAAPSPSSPPLANPDGPLTDDQAAKFRELKELICVGKGCQTGEEKAAAWKEALKPFGIESAAKLTAGRAALVIAELEKQHDPFAAGPRRQT